MKKIFVISLFLSLPFLAFAEHNYSIWAKTFRYDDNELVWQYWAKDWHKDFTTGKIKFSYGATNWSLDSNWSSSFSKWALKVDKSTEKIELKYWALDFKEENWVIIYNHGATKLKIDKDKIYFERWATKKEIDGNNWKYSKWAQSYQN